MKCLVMTTIDTSDGSYEFEFRRLDRSGGGIDFADVVEALYRSLGDLRARVDATQVEHAGELSAGDGEEVELHIVGDDVTIN